MRDYLAPRKPRFPGRPSAPAKNAVCCSDCGHDIVKGMSPPLSQRRGADGQPMTRAEAIHLFVDTRGGRCTDCYLKHEKAEVSRVTALHRADPGIRTRLWPDFGGFNNIRHLFLPQ